MCRFLVYRGRPILLAELLIRPANSLIKQSLHAREMPEPLKVHDAWHEVPPNHLLRVDPDWAVHLDPIPPGVERG